MGYCLALDMRNNQFVKIMSNFVVYIIIKIKSPKSGFVMKFKFTILLMACFVFAKAQNVNCVLRAHIEYPGQTLANICGYVKDNREYALLGGSQFTIIVDVTEPSTPVQVAQVPSVNNLWKEIKTYQHYAYVTSEGGGGLKIIDLDGLPSATLTHHNYTGDGAISGQLGSIHALHIDTTKGYCYLYGSNIGEGGAVILDLNQDPYNPVYAGIYDDQGYIHDGYVDNDTLFAGHIYDGTFEMVDCTNKANPVTIATQLTPGAFTHNTWPTADKRYVFTTDEVNNSFLTCYDVTDPGNIIEMDRVQSNPGSGSMVHNTHVRDEHYAITSWYKDGFTIVDITRPHNLVQVGNYDSSTASGGGSDGAWGVYPFFPSGTQVVSNIDEGLFVVTPTFVRACYLEGNVINGDCGGPLNNVAITIAGGNAGFATTSKGDGTYATGQVTPGNFNVTFSKTGFISQTFNVTLVNGELILLDVTMVPTTGSNSVDINGTTLSNETGGAIANAQVVMVGNAGTYEAVTDGAGSFSFECIPSGNYNVYAGAWGFHDTLISGLAISPDNNTPEIALSLGYKDDFVVDQGWTGSGDASTGLWEREVPVGTVYQNDACNPGNDIPGDLGNTCYMTGNGSEDASTQDVDDGNAVLTSPVMDLSGYINPILSYYTWFFNDGGSGNPNDHFAIKISNGNTTVTLEDIFASAGNWRPESVFHLADFIPLTNNMRLICETGDNSPGHLVEAALDAFLVVEGDTTSVGTATIQDHQIRLSPNPFTSSVTLQYDLKQVSGQVTCFVTDALGRLLETRLLAGTSGAVELGNDLGSGVYFIRLVSGDEAIYSGEVVKQ